MSGNTCYSCGQYSYRGKRHRSCPPRYSRSRLRECSVCGRACLGAKHRGCGAKEPTLSCGYCGGDTRGAFHNQCAPVGLGSLAVFNDMPAIVQRRCTGCGEWYPFASTDGSDPGTSDAWPRKGTPKSGRENYYGSTCKACLAERRRSGHRGQVDVLERTEMIAAYARGKAQSDIARAYGVSRRTVIRQIKAA